MSAKTLGQVAYEAYWEDDGWSELSDRFRARWESAVQTAIAAHEAAKSRPQDDTDGLEVGKVYTCKKGVGT